MSLGPAEILIILVVALLVLGPQRLPDAARQLGRAMTELRRMSSGFQAELRDALEPPVVPDRDWKRRTEPNEAGDNADGTA